MTRTSRLDTVNRAPDTQLSERLRSCNAAPRWIERVLAHRPYPDVDTFLDTAERVARTLPWSEVQEALDAHPRIGDRASGASTEARWSRREQSAVATSDAATQDALRAGNAAYERRFGHVFLIRAAGRSAEEMAAELDRRLGNDEVRERAEVTEQLAQITRLRVETLLTDRHPNL
jgi:2-oxo-4-hydroxy-4-carboxy-5-ureidoimidazoline decarboxylase